MSTPIIERFGEGDREALRSLQIVVTERPVSMGRLPKYYARVRNLEVMERGMLASVAGNGETPEQAIEDYEKRLRGHRVAVDAHTPNRCEYSVPNDFTFMER